MQCFFLMLFFTCVHESSAYSAYEYINCSLPCEQQNIHVNDRAVIECKGFQERMTQCIIDPTFGHGTLYDYIDPAVLIKYFKGRQKDMIKKCNDIFETFFNDKEILSEFDFKKSSFEILLRGRSMGTTLTHKKKDGAVVDFKLALESVSKSSS